MDYTGIWGCVYRYIYICIYAHVNVGIYKVYGPCSQEFGTWDCGTSNSYAGVGQFSTDLAWFRALGS